MPFGTSRARHRVEFAAAVLVAVVAVYGLSRLSRLAKGSGAETTAAPALPPFVPAPPIVPRVDPPLGTQGAGPSSPPVPPVSPALLDAASEGNVERLNALFHDGMNLTAAHLLGPASASGHIDAVVWLLDHAVDVHESEGESDAPILLADAYPAVTQVLLSRGAAEPKLAVAALGGASNTVKRLLAAGVDPNLGDGAVTPLSAALERCRHTDDPASGVKVLGLLTARGARVTGEDLSAALALPNEIRDVVVASLLSAPLAPDATAIALSRAEGARDARLVPRIAIASHGVAWVWHDGDDDARAPLFDAIDRLDVLLVRALLDAGAPADVHLKDGRSPLGLALEQAVTGELDAARIVDALLAHGASANRRLGDGSTPLIVAARMGQVRIVRALLDHGARANEIVLDATALDEAERAGQVDAARVLEARGGRRVVRVARWPID